MADWIIVVDDDTTNLQVAGQILSRRGMRVTALKSGRAMLDYIADHGVPDLVLLDIMMPDMDGFETLECLRTWESEQGKPEVPVIFLTSEEDSDVETKGFEKGVSDFIRKPFNPDVLLRRIDHILSTTEKLNRFEEDAMTDAMTGFFNKAATHTKLEQICRNESGCLCMIDLDSFKPVNDLYGHDIGDKVISGHWSLVTTLHGGGSVTQFHYRF